MPFYLLLLSWQFWEWLPYFLWLWVCLEHVRSCWTLEFNWAKKIYQVESISKLIFKLLETSNSNLQSRIAMVLWCIWRRRNKRLWNEVDTTPNISISLTMQFFHEWSHARKTSQPPRAIHTTNTHSWWTKPQKDYLKINVDATLFTNENKFGIGLCLHSEDRTFTKTMQDSRRPKVKEAGAWAFFHAIKWAQELNIFKVIFENDCKALVDNLQENQHGFFEYHMILLECRTRIIVMFQTQW